MTATESPAAKVAAPPGTLATGQRHPTTPAGAHPSPSGNPAGEAPAGTLFDEPTPPVVGSSNPNVPDRVAAVPGTRGAVAEGGTVTAPTPRVVGIDLSLTSTGMAFIWRPAAPPTVLRITSKPPITPRHPRTGKPLPPTLAQRRARLDKIVSQIVEEVHVVRPDLVGIEQPAYSKNAGAAHDRSGLWWLLVDELSKVFPVVEITPSGRAKYATGKGNAGKDDVLAAVVRRYPNVETRGNDEADALVLAAMCSRHLGHPIDDMPKVNLDAMTAIVWPVTT